METWLDALRNLLPNFALAGLSVEFTMLGLAIVLGLLQLLVAARTGNSQRGLAWNVGARDKEPPPVGAVAGRLERAFRNFMETFPFFAVAVLAAHATDRFGWMTLLGTQLYVAARVVYVPLYAAGVPVVRTVVWLISIAGLILTLAALFVEPTAALVAPGDFDIDGNATPSPQFTLADAADGVLASGQP